MRWARRAVELESGVWRSLFRWVARRPLPTGAFSYAQAAAPLLWVFVALSAVEIPLLHVVLPSWTWLQVSFLVLGAWGLIWMLGLLASMYVQPHLVTPGGLRVRSGILLDLDIPWKIVDSVELRRRTWNGTKTLQYAGTPEGELLAVAAASSTTIEVRFVEPTVLPLPGGPKTLVGVCFHADDPRALLARVREVVC